MDATQFNALMQHVVTVMRQAGNDPVKQLIEYIRTDDESYITRRGNARRIVRTMNKEKVKEYFLFEDVNWELSHLFLTTQPTLSLVGDLPYSSQIY